MQNSPPRCQLFHGNTYWPIKSLLQLITGPTTGSELSSVLFVLVANFCGVAELAVHNNLCDSGRI